MAASIRAVAIIAIAGVVLPACGILVKLEAPGVVDDDGGDGGGDVLPGDGGPSEDRVFVEASSGSDADAALVDASACSIESTTAATPLVVTVTGSGNPWSATDALKLEDGAGAVSAGCCSVDTQVLNAVGFGLAVPPDAAIRGVKVEIRVRGSIDGTLADKSVKLVPDSQALGSDLKSAATYVTSFETHAYGDERNLWGRALTPAIVNAADFGVALRATRNPLIAASAEVDVIRLTVFYCR